MYTRAVETTLPPFSDMEVRLTNAYIDVYGSYHLLGTVKNNGTSQISPAVIGGLYNVVQEVFDAASLRIPLYLNPGESVPFDMNGLQIMGSMSTELSSPADKIVKPDLYWTFTTDHEVVSLEASNIKITQNALYWTVTGTVTNTSDRNLSSITAILAFLDQDQQVMATSSTSIYPPEGSEVIEAGASSEFSISIYAAEEWDLNSQQDEFVLQGIVAE